MERKELTCISCPMGCLLTVEMNDSQISVTGNGCKIGLEYGRNEVTNPKRMITTSIKIKDLDGNDKMLSVKTSDTIPKDKVFDCLSVIKQTDIRGDFSVGDVIIENILNLNVEIIATRAIQ